jgi:hypothetical protein
MVSPAWRAIGHLPCAWRRDWLHSLAALLTLAATCRVAIGPGWRGPRSGDGGGRRPGAVPPPRRRPPPSSPPGGQLRPRFYADERWRAAQHRRPQGQVRGGVW